MTANVLKITFILSVLNFSLWSWIKDMTGLQVYYIGNAAAYVGYLYVIYVIVDKSYKANSKHSDLLTWCEIALGAALSNLIDELFFDPTVLSWNEYIGLLLIIAYALYNDRKRKRQNR